MYGRLLAVVLTGAEGEPSVQERVVLAGWSCYWRKYGSAPAPLDGRLQAAQEAAKKAGSGAWGSAAAWMADRANERTAPRR